MEKIQLLVPVFYKILRNKKDISVSQIYGEMYNTGMFKDFILKLGVTSYDIVVASYALYYMLTNPNLKLSDAIDKAIHSIFLVRSITIEDKESIQVDCPECEGEGRFNCDECLGDGTVSCDVCDGTGADEKDEECDECSGRGENTCDTCGGEEYVDCSECYGSGQIESDEEEVNYSKEYLVVSNPEVFTQLKMRDENSYIDPDTLEEIIDTDVRTSLYLGYASDTLEVQDFIKNYNLDVENVSHRDTFFLDIDKLYPSVVLSRLVGLNKFGRMI